MPKANLYKIPHENYFSLIITKTSEYLKTIKLKYLILLNQGLWNILPKMI